MRHRLQLSPQQLSGGADGEGSEGGCEGGACQYRSVLGTLYIYITVVLKLLMIELRLLKQPAQSLK